MAFILPVSISPGRGDLAQAVAYGEESVAHADRSDDDSLKIASRTILAALSVGQISR